MAALTAGCSYSPDYAGTSFSCTNGTCPPGFACVADTCVQPAEADAAPGAPDAAPGSSADAAPGAPDAAPPGADAGVATCGDSMGRIDDDFDDGAAAPLWQTVDVLGNASYAEQNSRAVFTLDLGGEVRLSTGCNYSAVGATIAIEGLELAASTGAIGYLRLVRSATELASVSVTDQQVFIEVLAPGSTATDTRTADPGDRYYRIQENAGRFLFASSADGVAWNALGDHAVPFDATGVEVVIGAGAGAGATTVSVDRVRGSP